MVRGPREPRDLLSAHRGRPDDEEDIALHEPRGFRAYGRNGPCGLRGSRAQRRGADLQSF